MTDDLLIEWMIVWLVDNRIQVELKYSFWFRHGWQMNELKITNLFLPFHITMPLIKHKSNARYSKTRAKIFPSTWTIHLQVIKSIDFLVNAMATVHQVSNDKTMVYKIILIRVQEKTTPIHLSQPMLINTVLTICKMQVFHIRIEPPIKISELDRCVH